MTASSKERTYQLTLEQIKALISKETDTIANMANIAAVLKEAYQFWWVGFYIVKNEELILGPFQGPVACTRIKYGRGVCGTAWKEDNVILVPDVDLFKGHIACSSASRSEIVLPIHSKNEVVGVLDIDSEYLNHFDKVDENYLKQIVQLLETTLI